MSIATIGQQFKEGWLYAYRFQPMRAVLLLMALVSFVGMPHVVLLPIFAADVLHGGANTLGVLTAASGIGALIAGVRLSLRKTIRGLGRWIAVAPALMGFGLVTFSLSRHLWLSALAMVLVGFGFLTQFASSNTIIQTIVEDDKRSRVMSLYIIAFMGVMPLGSLLAGSIADWLGAPTTVLLGGGICILGSVLFSRELPRIRQILRPIYREAGVS